VSLSASFAPHLAGWPAPVAASLDALLADLLAASRAAWPGVAVADVDFLPFLAARVPAGPPLDESLRALCVTDLYLAAGIAAGDAAALRAFDTRCLRDLGAAIAHLDGGSALVEDVRQALRERVLVAAAGGKAKITEYAGRGDLRGWLRVVAVREALQLLRQRRREVQISDGDLATCALADDPALAFVDARYRAAFRTAFTAALASLTPRERNLLRQQYLLGLTIDDLAALYRAHRATVARWVARTRERVLKRTRRGVGDALGLAGDDLDSVMGLVGDNLDHSLRCTLSIDDP